MDRRGFLGAGLSQLLAASIAQAQQGPSLPESPPAAAPVQSADANRRNDVVNAKDFGAIGNGLANDTAAIQAAIDWAATHARSGVYLPAGKYRITAPLFLDPPGNLRASLSEPKRFNFSMALVGDPGLGNHEGWGTQILPINNTFVALWVGPGQGMHVGSISIVAPWWRTHRSLMPSAGCGIAIAGGPGGASRTLLERCEVANYFYGITTSLNGVDQLADSNTLIKCLVHNCCRGVSFLKPQNYINSLYDCNVTNCGTAIHCSDHILVNVVGGNYSNYDAAHKRFAISNISALVEFPDIVAGNGFTNYRFTAVVSAPDALMRGGGYGACAISTTGFGVIPLRLESFDPLNNAATFSFWPYWRFATFGQRLDVRGATDLQVELQAANQLFACEWIRVFAGGQFSVHGIHLENPQSVTTLISGTRGVVEASKFNYDITHADHARAANPDDTAPWQCQQAFPFIVNSAGTLRLRDNNFYFTAPVDSITIDVGGPARSMFENNDLFSPNIRYCSGEPNITGHNGVAAETKVRGHGEWDVNPWPPRAIIGNGGWINALAKAYSINQSPMRGYRPDPKFRPRLTPKQLAEIEAGRGALGSYPPLNGETVYEVLDHDTGDAPFLFARSAHQFYSYGRDLTPSQIRGLAWTYKGQSSILRLDAGSLSWMFPGLKIILDNARDGDRSYLVTGVYPGLGYVVVTRIDEQDSVLVGVKNTSYSGTIIKQEPYRIRRYA